MQYKHNTLDTRQYSGKRHLSASISTPLYRHKNAAPSYQNALM